MGKITAWGNPQSKMANDKNQDVKLFVWRVHKVVSRTRTKMQCSQMLHRGYLCMCSYEFLIMLSFIFQIFYNEHLLFL